MKKFMKNCAIAALALLVIGFILAMVAGGMSDSNHISEVVDSVTNGKIHVDVSGLEDLGNTIKEGIEGTVGQWDVNYDISEETTFDDDYEILKGDIEKYCPGDSITKLDIEVGGCSFETKESEDDKLYLEVVGAYKFQSYVKGSTLHIKSTMGTATWSELDDCEIILYIPSGFQFKEIDLEIGAGVVEFENLAVKDGAFEVGAGQLILDGISAEEVSFSVGAGDIKLSDMEVAVLDMEVGMGKCTASGKISKSADVECAMGGVELNIDGNKKDFNYKIEGAMGNITLDDETYSGMANEKEIANGADKNMTVECAMGGIVINFTE